MQLKMKVKGKWNLIPMKGELTPEELKPYENTMKLHSIAALKIGERVLVPFVGTKKKKDILQWLAKLDADRKCTNCGEPMRAHVGARRLCPNGKWNNYGKK